MPQRNWRPLAVLVAAVAAGCGSTASRTPDTAGAAGSQTVSAGGSASAAGNAGNTAAGSTAAGSLSLPTGGSKADPTASGGAPDFAQGGALPEYPEVSLCLEDEEIPAAWASGGAGDGSIQQCAVGVVGEFVAQDCLYRLLAPAPFDVDPFSGGHSHCCYRSQLVTCMKR